MTNEKTIAECLTELVKELGEGHEITSQEIRHLMKTKYGKYANSVLPSDFCYNRVNNGITKYNKNRIMLFEYLSKGNYRCLGENYSYSGVVLHQPKGGSEIVIGYYKNGDFFAVEKTETQERK